MDPKAYAVAQARIKAHREATEQAYLAAEAEKRRLRDNEMHPQRQQKHSVFSGVSSAFSHASSKFVEVVDHGTDYAKRHFDKVVTHFTDEQDLRPPQHAFHVAHHYKPVAAHIHFSEQEVEQLFFLYRDLVGYRAGIDPDTSVGFMSLEQFSMLLPAKLDNASRIVLPNGALLSSTRDRATFVSPAPLIAHSNHKGMGEHALPLSVRQMMYRHACALLSAPELDFGCFVRFLSIVVADPPAHKIDLLFDIFSSERGDEVTAVSFSATAHCIAGALLSAPIDSLKDRGSTVQLQLFQPLQEDDVREYVAQIVLRWRDYTAHGTCDRITRPEWRAMCRDLSQLVHSNTLDGNTAWLVSERPEVRSLFECFGLFTYVYETHVWAVKALAAGDVSLNSRLKPRVEGLIVYEEKGRLGSVFKKAWVEVHSGFFHRYRPSSLYTHPIKVQCLEGCEFEDATSEQHDHCILVKLADSNFRIAFSSEDMKGRWLQSLKAHSTSCNFGTARATTPDRVGNCVQWYVDGADMYLAAAEAMEAAKHQIFITDWFFTPELFLERTDKDGSIQLHSERRLDKILARKAEQGVEIFVLPWSETKLALGLNSANVKLVLEALSDNIKVLCHPVNMPVKWSHHQKTIVVDQRIAFVGGLDLCLGRWDLQSHPISDIGAHHFFPGKDYYNPAYAEFAGVEDPFTDMPDLNRHKHPRMGWHDVHSAIAGPAARDVARNFIQRWNHHRRELCSSYRYLVPDTSFVRPHGMGRVQLLRSVSSWSCGIPVPERSIYNTYVDAINYAEHFIFIENQYFISSTAGGCVENLIATALFQRISRAIANQEPFRVLIIVPRHPEGSVESAATRYIMFWQYSTIGAHSNSLLQALARSYPGVDISQYIAFYSLRHAAPLHEKLVTEQIYVHSKLMIVDDRVVLVGSANINDRSMDGDRDSEIAVCVRDTDWITAQMCGKPYYVTRFAHELRVQLMAEHLGLLSDYNGVLREAVDPFTAYTCAQAKAKANTSILKSVFGDEGVASKSVDRTLERDEWVGRLCGHLSLFDHHVVPGAELLPTYTDVDILLAGDDVFT
eukprot:TRINITY_DN2931_c1_g1_i1.p1 TRINITY_DN2931_c1_g1~~TRINITY_DN2931_c1_g1_i1.p1  ORF type:complete len:1082 (+),score=270.33 TRINITY_DN2931_c1_g1_i1:44-3247(+)